MTAALSPVLDARFGDLANAGLTYLYARFASLILTLQMKLG